MCGGEGTVPKLGECGDTLGGIRISDISVTVSGSKCTDQVQPTVINTIQQFNQFKTK
jgi:hypothetical protein